MKADLYIQVICPGCKCVLYRETDNIHCQTPSCKYYLIKFEHPHTEITLLEKK